MPVTGSTSSGQMGDCVHTTATKPRSKSSSGKTGRQNSKKESKSKRGGSMKKRDPSDMPAEVGIIKQFFTHYLFSFRNLANHMYAKVYETQEDLCHKRNEIRVANMQLAGVRAQVR